MTRELVELDAALARVVDGTYGLCESCGRPIPLERLQLLPAATLCVPCAGKR
ncbi:TraR/DksA family transcriptional regulator [Microbacterium sp.]|uniref:TraR/DksA family transcriptional regulator n=1 Tax=Microbacterium sp. TaxID=51671 RepID=UPI002E306FD9|nr:TraR/DksA C4-type zinc finger protein [Microbacterium sp.]HEX5730431.1 TraR/DksA C4-type zinc finger protein [Microbacterium sp.]